MSDVFISYSRRNSDFARKLTDRLIQANKESWVDWEGIPLSAPSWWDEIKAGIENADSFVFIMSPGSMASVVCNMELDYAIELGKRIVPILYEMIESHDAFVSMSDYNPDKAMQERLQGKTPVLLAQDNWNQLSHINWIYFRESDDFDRAFKSLIQTVETDLDYVKAHTRYLIRAQEWQRNSHRSDLLIFGEEIDRAEHWLNKARAITQMQNAPKTEAINPGLVDVQETFITRSRSQATQRQRLIRGAQLSIVALIIVAVIGFSLLFTTRQQVVNAQNTLTPIPMTIAFAQEQVTQAIFSQNEAVALAQAASTDLAIVNTQSANAIATVTIAAANFDIINAFANVILQPSTDRSLQLSDMNVAVVRYPDEPLVYLARGLLYAEQNDSRSALDDYTRVIELDPQNKYAYYNRGVSHWRLGDSQEAIDDFTQAITLDSRYSEAFNNRGKVYYDSGDYELAIADYTQAVALNDQYATAFYNRGLAHYRLGNSEEALADFDEAIKVDPNYANAYNNRGNLHSDFGNTEQALADYDYAITLNPQFALAYANRGTIHYQLDDFETALADFTRALELNPQDVVSYRNRATTYYYLEEYANALADYEMHDSLGGTLLEWMQDLRDDAQEYLDDSK